MALGVTVVSGSEIVLKIHLQVAMLRAALAKESVGDVALLGVVPDDLLLCSS
jgi:hypothetical protein